MKKFLVVLLALAMVFGLGSVAFAADTQIADYADLAGVPAEQQAAIYRLTALGVLAGDGVGGDFRPEDTITRAEFAKIAIFLAGKADAVDLYASFAPAYADVQDGTWYEGYVNAAVAFGYMKGYTDGTFKPGQTVTMQEVATVLLRIAGYTDALKGTWPNDYIRKANDTEIIKYVDFVGPKAATRAEVASLANETLDLGMVTEIENEVAAGLGQVFGSYVQGEYDYVDEDGFAYIKIKTNEGDLAYETVLSYAFDAEVKYYQFDAPNAADEYVETIGWDFENYAKGELFFQFTEKADQKVAADYYIFGADLFSVAGHQAAVTVVDGKAAFVEILSERVAFNKVEEVNNTKETAKLDGTKYDFVDVSDANFTDGSYGYAWVGTDAKKADDTYVNATAKDKVYYVYDMVDAEDMTWDIFDKVEVDDEDVELFFEGTMEIAFDTEEINETVLFIKDGEFVTYEDLADDDVLFALNAVENDKEGYAYPAYLVVSPVEGEMNKLYTETKEEIKLDDVVYTYGTVAVDTQYSKDNGEDYEDADYDKLYAGDLEEVAYVPHYAWKSVATIIADIEEAETEIYGIVLGYEAGKKTIGFDKTENPKDDLTQVDEITAITVLTKDGEEVTYKFKDLAKLIDGTDSDTNAEYTCINGLDDAGILFTEEVKNLPELGDAVQIVINEKDQIVDMDLIVAFSDEEIRDYAALGMTGEFEIRATGRVKVGNDWFTVTEDTIVAGVYSDEDATTDIYSWANFEKAEIIDAEDVIGKKITVDYFDAIVDGREVTHIYMANPEYVGAKGDITLAIAEEHYQSKKVEYIALTDGTELIINEEYEGDFDNKFEDDGLYPMVVLYCLNDGELTVADDANGTIAKGEIVKLVDENGLVANETNANLLIDEYFEDGTGEDDLYAIAELVPVYETYDADMEDIQFTNGKTFYFGDVKVVDLTDDDCDELSMKRAAKKIMDSCDLDGNGEPDYSTAEYALVLVTYDSDEVVLAWLVNVD